MLDIATQGRTEEEVKENMVDLIEEYKEDPDTQKPDCLAIHNPTIWKVAGGILLSVKSFKEAFMEKCCWLKNLSFKKKPLSKKHYALYTIKNGPKKLCKDYANQLWVFVS